MKHIIAVVLLIITIPAFGADVMSKRQVERCADLSDEIDDNLDVINSKDQRIRRAERVIRSYGCYKFGTTWNCSGLTPEQDFNVKMTLDARNRAAQTLNRIERETNPMISRFNKRCVGVEYNTKHHDDVCRFRDNKFCDN